MSSTTPPPPEEPLEPSAEDGATPPPPPPAQEPSAEDVPTTPTSDPSGEGTFSTPPPPPPPAPAFEGGYPPPPPPSEGGYPPPPPPAEGGYLPAPTAPGAYDSGMPAAPPPFPGAAAPPRNNRAVISLVTGIAGIVFAFCCSPIGLVLGLVGAVLGYLTRAEIQRTGVGKESENLALAGLITGAVGVVLSVVAFAVGASNVLNR